MKPGTAETAVKRVEMLGEIAWPTAMAWPDVAYYASVLGGGMQYPTQQYHDAAIYLMGYMLNNASDGITYGGTLRAPLGISELPAGFAAAHEGYTRRATTGDSSWGKKPLPHGSHLVLRTNAAIMWKAKALRWSLTAPARRRPRRRLKQRKISSTREQYSLGSDDQ